MVLGDVLNHQLLSKSPGKNCQQESLQLRQFSIRRMTSRLLSIKKTELAEQFRA